VADLGALGALHDRLRACEEAASADPSYTRGAWKMRPVLTEVWPSMFDGVRALLARDRPDLMIVDLFSSAGYCAAADANIPFVINNPALLSAVPVHLMPPAPGVPFVTTGRSIHQMRWRHRASEPLLRILTRVLVATMLTRPVNRLRAERRLPRIDPTRLLRDRLILVNGAFGLEYERPLPANVRMVGPMLDDRVPANSPETEAWLADGAPVVYANLGTVSRAPAAQLAKMVAAFDGEDMRVLWVVRVPTRDRLPAALPAGVRVVNWVESPRAVLAHPNVRVFVSHCGINSVYESMMTGTPVVGIPMLSDQRDMAVRVADAGVGLWVDKTRFTAAQLRTAIDRVRQDPQFRSRIVPIQQACAAAGGIGRAVDLIEAQVQIA
jgi:MGT family glycosyltransferase